jgi:hypothetical protein
MDVMHMAAATKLALPAVAVALLLAACGGRAVSGSAPPSGTVHGSVLAGPTCPVERVGHPCPPRPVVATIQASEGTRVVASTRSATDGTYRLAVPAGSFTIRAVTGTAFPRCGSQPVVVATGTDVEVALTCDTGIR